jgi:hypothetical protein
VHQIIRIAKQALGQHDLRDLLHRRFKRANRLAVTLFSVANTIARKLNPILAGSRLARYPVMAPLCSSARTRRWHGERLRFTRSASSVSDRRPSDCSSARIFRSMLSMWKIFSFSPCYEHNIESLFRSVSDILFRNV